jgi:predicted dehydrogenase
VAVPKWRHAEFVIPALRAGIHVLCEKRMEVSTAKCQEILDIVKTASAKPVQYFSDCILNGTVLGELA